MNVFKERRRRLGEFLLSHQCLAVLSAHTLQTRSNDTHFSFRQNSDFYYLTGLQEPDSILILSTEDNILTSHLFLHKQDTNYELWNGPRLDKDLAKEEFFIDKTYDLEDFHKIFPLLLVHHKSLSFDCYNESKRNDFMQIINKTCGDDQRTKMLTPNRIFHINPLIRELRSFKDLSEIKTLRQASKITEKAHRAALALLAPGKNESEIEALIEYIFKKEGSSSPAYKSIVAGGERANILHYTENKKILKEDELLLLDAGCEYNMYASDVTRTIPVSGTFKGISREIYSLVLSVQKKAIESCVSGSTLTNIHKDVQENLLIGLLEANILKGSKEEHQEKKTIHRYYPHGTSHWMGLDVHDPCPYQDNDDRKIILKSSMVFTVEPGLYFPVNDLQISAELRGIGIRIEDDILIEKDKAIVLTDSIPKEIDDLEEHYREDYRTFLT